MTEKLSRRSALAASVAGISVLASATHSTASDKKRRQQSCCCCQQPVSQCCCAGQHPSATEPMTNNNMICRIFQWANWGTYASYYAIHCPTGTPLNYDGAVGLSVGYCPGPTGCTPAKLVDKGNGIQVLVDLTQKKLLRSKWQIDKDPNNSGENNGHTPKFKRVHLSTKRDIIKTGSDITPIYVQLSLFEVESNKLNGDKFEVPMLVGLGHEVDTPGPQHQNRIVSGKLMRISEYDAVVVVGSVIFRVTTVTPIPE